MTAAAILGATFGRRRGVIRMGSSRRVIPPRFLVERRSITWAEALRITGASKERIRRAEETGE